MRRFLLLTLLCCISLVSAGETAYKFTHFNTANSGISYDGVSKIMQDSRGYIWIGTFNGLNRFDGLHFNAWRKDALGLPSDFIHNIVEDAEGNLWIGTDAGCTRYLWKEDRFEAFDAATADGTVIRNKVTWIYRAPDDKVWFLVNYQGIFCYCPDTGTLLNWGATPVGDPEYSPDNLAISFRRMVSDGAGGFWLSRYYKGLFYSDATFTSVEPLRPRNAPDYFDGDEIEQLFSWEGKLLIVSNRNGVSRYDPETRIVETLFSKPADTSMVDAFLEDDRFIWIATANGVWRLDLQREQASVCLHQVPDDRLSITGQYVFSCFVDKDAGVWIGTKDGGVSYSGFPQNLVEKIYICQGEPLDGAIISSLSWDGKDQLWISGENAPLMRYSISGRSLKRVEIPSLPSPRTFAFWENGRLWIGTHNGLYRYTPATRKLENKGVLERSGATDPKIYLAYQSPQGDLLFANTLGLYRYAAETDSFSPVPELDGVFVTSVTDAPGGRYWVSSYAVGLFEWDPAASRVVRRFRYGDGSGLPSDKIVSLLTDRQGRLWVIGFSSGFARLDGDRFTVFDKNSVPDLPSDNYFSAVEDEDGTLWLTSDKGLVQFNPADGSVRVLNEAGGLLDGKLSRSLLRLPSGDIFAGSDNGLIRFNPQAVDMGDTPPRVIINRMRVGGGSLPGNVDLKENVVLEPGQSAFGFYFSLTGLTLPSAGRLKCFLEGYDDHWRDISVSRAVYYFNVPPGKYRLRLRSSASGKTWAEDHAPVTVVVQPRFFASAAGISLILIFMLLLAALLFWLMDRRRRAKVEEEEEAYRRKTDAELVRSKMDFFSHIVHEIKTPLTLIGTPLQSVMSKEKLDEEARRDLAVMKSNTDYLTRLVNELLEFARVERKGYILNCEPMDLVELLDATVFNYSEAASAKGLRLNFLHSAPELWVNADRPAVSKILNNLLINALKFASSVIEVRLELESGVAVLEISNDGEPIPPQMRDDVFKPFVSYEGGHGGATNGFGIGLALSRSLAQMHGGALELLPGELTAFRLRLPALQSAPFEKGSVESEEAPAASGDPRPVLLIVEDNGELRDFLARKMEADYTVQMATCVEEALSVLAASDVDIMLTDITMPGKDGLELCRVVRSDPENSHLPIIVLSARTSVESKIQAMESGADLYIEKPFDLEYLRTSMRNILERRDLMRNALTSGIGETDVTLFGLPKRDEEFFRTFDDFIKENIGNSELSNDMIADALCMSQSSMIRKIRRLLDTSPSNYIRSKRLAAAAQMLRDAHGNNVTDICYAVGFTSASYFAKCFREKYGVTPTEYAMGGGGKENPAG